MHLQKLIVYQLGPSLWLYSCLSLKIGVSIALFKKIYDVPGRDGLQATHTTHKLATKKPVI